MVALDTRSSSRAGRPSPVLKTTVADFGLWVAAASPGETLEYYRGFLMIDRQSAASRLDKPDSEELDRVADAALALANIGRVHLVQRRHGDGDFSYLAVARSIRSTGGRS